MLGAAGREASGASKKMSRYVVLAMMDEKGASPVATTVTDREMSPEEGVQYVNHPFSRSAESWAVTRSKASSGEVLKSRSRMSDVLGEVSKTPFIPTWCSSKFDKCAFWFERIAKMGSRYKLFNVRLDVRNEELCPTNKSSEPLRDAEGRAQISASVLTQPAARPSYSGMRCQ